MITDKDLIAVTKIRKYVVDTINLMEDFNKKIECFLSIDGTHAKCHEHPAAKKFVKDNNIEDQENLYRVWHGVAGSLTTLHQTLDFIDEKSLLED